MQQREEEALDIKAREQAVLRSLLALQREQRSVQAELAAVRNQLRTEEAQIGRTLAALQQERAENAARRQVLVRAPKALRVTALHVQPGRGVQAGQVLADAVDPATGTSALPLGADLYAPSRLAGFVQPGQSVWLRFAAFPYQRFGFGRAEVVAVSATPVAPQDLPPGHAQALQQAAQSQEPMYRISARLQQQAIVVDGRELPLSPGMVVDGDIVRDRLAVWQWALEPLLAARGWMHLKENKIDATDRALPGRGGGT